VDFVSNGSFFICSISKQNIKISNGSSKLVNSALLLNLNVDFKFGPGKKEKKGFPWFLISYHISIDKESVPTSPKVL
jgi:hypothetical protein